jgi:HPr kinase/phosphorylase
MLIHASCVAINNKAVLIVGPPGSGKSDLALRLVDDGAQLIADDQVELQLDDNGHLQASAPISILGLIEVRHIGLLKMPYAGRTPVAQYVELSLPEEKLERLPEAQTILVLGQSVRCFKLPSFAASTPAKIRAALSLDGL